MINPDFGRIAAKADVCRLLAACYYEPETNFTEEGLFVSLVDAAGHIDADLAARARDLQAAFVQVSNQELLVDYARLFVGPKELLAAPYESVWLEKEALSSIDSTQMLLSLFADGGFEVDPEFLDLPDHIAVQLEFLYTILFRQAAALRDGDDQVIGELNDLRERLVVGHLDRWLPAFQNAVLEGAQSQFYRDLVDLTVLFVNVARREAASAAC